MSLEERINTEGAKMAEEARLREENERAQQEKLEAVKRKLDELGKVLDPLVQNINESVANNQGHIRRSADPYPYRENEGMGCYTAKIEWEEHSHDGKRITLILMENGQACAVGGKGYRPRLQSLNEWVNINEPGWQEALEERIAILVVRGGVGWHIPYSTYTKDPSDYGGGT